MKQTPFYCIHSYSNLVVRQEESSCIHQTTKKKTHLSIVFHSIMGLLKHVILPLFTLIDFIFIYMFIIKEELDDDIKQDWDVVVHPIDAPLDPITIHFMNLAGTLGCVMAMNNIAAIFYGNEFHRAIACSQKLIVFVVDYWSYTHTGRNLPTYVYAIGVTSLIGLLVHSQEPGIFTKDKEQEEEKQKKTKSK